MAEELLIALTGLLGGALLTVATLAGGFLFRKVHEQGNRILSLEARMSNLKPVEDLLGKFGSGTLERRFGGGRRAR